MTKPSDSNKYSVECIYQDSEGFRITSELLRRVLKEAKTVKKLPKIKLILNNNTDKNRFVLDITIKLENK